MPAAHGSGPVSFGVFRFDPATGDLWKDGHSIRLQEQPRQVLALLVASAGRVVSREELRATLWPKDTFVDFDTGLNVVINKIRQALGDTASAPRFIETIPRRGYRFVAPVITVPPSPSPASWWRHPVLIAGLAVVLVAGITWRVWQPRTGAAGTADARIQSLAVLPLENLSGNASEDYLVEGVADALTTDLAGIRALRVISRQSMKAYKGTTKPVTAIARELNIDAVIEGSVLRSGNRIRLNLQLIDARNDRHMWARGFEGEFGAILQLQREAAAAIAEEIKVATTPAERARMRHARPITAAAHDAWLRGRYALGLSESEATTARALEEFQTAIKLDPMYAPAYAGMAEAYQLRGTYLGGRPPIETRPLAFAAASRAVELDPELGDAHAIEARIRLSEFDWRGAEESFARMLELAPNHPSGLVWYAYSLLVHGRVNEMLEVAARAEAADPLNLNTRTRVGFIMGFANRDDEAIRRYREVLALDAGNSMARGFLVDTLSRSGKHAEAIEAANEELARNGRTPLVLSHLARVNGRAGHIQEARRPIDELLSLSKRQYVSPAHLAFAYVGIGDRDRAFDWLERAYDERSNNMMYFGADKLFELHDDSRYARLVAKVRAQHSVRTAALSVRPTS
jgi:TolB-like protein/DNA-binding winged helix-turn-helix (wHTH) protein/Tfp pilus assembly protein PilF